MAKIEFKGKVQKVYNMDDTLAFEYVRVPALAYAHCDMNAFRRHPKYGSYANSDLFKNMLARIAKDKGLGERIRLDRIPEGVTVDTSGFLAKVSFDV